MSEFASNPPDPLQPRRTFFQNLAIFLAVFQLLDVVWTFNQLRTVDFKIAENLTFLLFFSLCGWKRPEALPRWAKAVFCVLAGLAAVLIALQVYDGWLACGNCRTVTPVR